MTFVKPHIHLPHVDITEKFISYVILNQVSIRKTNELIPLTEIITVRCKNNTFTVWLECRVLNVEICN